MLLHWYPPTLFCLFRNANGKDTCRPEGKLCGPSLDLSWGKPSTLWSSPYELKWNVIADVGLRSLSLFFFGKLCAEMFVFWYCWMLLLLVHVHFMQSLEIKVTDQWLLWFLSWFRVGIEIRQISLLSLSTTTILALWHPSSYSAWACMWGLTGDLRSLRIQFLKTFNENNVHAFDSSLPKLESYTLLH